MNRSPKQRLSRGWRAWLAPWGRGPEYWAFVFHRLSGLGLVVYLGLHLSVLYRLTQGPQAWDAFLRLARSPGFLALDGVLFVGLTFHLLNGLRIAIVGAGMGVRQRRELLAGVVALTLGLALAMMVALARM